MVAPQKTGLLKALRSLSQKFQNFVNGASHPGKIPCLGIYERKLDTNIGYGIDILKLEI